MVELVTTRPSYFFLTPPTRLKRELAGKRFTALTRIGKYLLAELEDGARLLLHLGMTGQLFSSTVHSPRLISASARAALEPSAQASFRPDLHTHLQFHFEDGPPSVFFRDVRKFGKVALLPAGKNDRRLSKLGPDALQVDAPTLHGAFKRRRIPVKTVLLDQGVIAGVGNIYADEALYLAQVSPLRRAHRVTFAEAERIALAVRSVLERSIAAGGSSISDFVQPDGSDGHYQDERHVYARAGLGCGRCGTAIRRRVIGARSSHYCPVCQR